MNYRLLTAAEVCGLLEPFGCRHVDTVFPGYEIWETGWGFAFTLSREPDMRHYDEWMVRQVISLTIAETMPVDWSLEK